MSLKIKNVKVSEFRAFRNPDNANFDFRINGTDNLATFISIYAPNGFGKTSFNDAVEWAITKQLSRFSFSQKENDKLIKEQNNKNDSIYSIIRNHNATSETYVNVETNKVGVNFKNILDSKVIKPKRELNISGRLNSENTGFNKVMLSQDWISRFLSEENGEKRYEIFNDHPEIIDLDKYYQGLNTLIGTYNSQIKVQLEENLKKQELVVQNFKKQDFGKNLTKLLESLASSNIVFKTKLDLENNLSFLMFKDEISTKISELSASQDQLHKRRLTVENLMNGDNGISLTAYYENKTKTNDLKKEHEIINEILKALERSESIKSILEIEKENLGRINYLIDNITSIEETNQSIKANEKEVIKLTNQIPKLVETKTSKVLDKNDKTAVVQNIINQIAQLEQDIFRAKSEYEKHLNNLNKLSKLKKEIDTEKAKLKDTSKLEVDIRYLKKVVKTNLKEDLDKLPFIIPQLSNADNEIKSIIKEKTSLELKIEELVILKDQNINLDDTLQKLINDGLNIANSTKLSSCPLCEQDYNTFENLIVKISENKALGDTIQNLQNQINILEKRKSKYKEQYDKYKKETLNVIKGILDKKENNLKIIIEDNIRIDQIIESKEINTKKINIEISKFINRYGNFTLDDYINEKSLELNSKIDNRSSLNLLLEDITNQISEIENQIINIQSDIKVINQSVEDLQANPIYNTFKASLAEQDKDNLSLEDLKLLSIERETRIKALTDQLRDIENQLSEFNVVNIITGPTEIKIRKEEISNKISLLTKGIDWFSSKFNELFDKEIINYELEGSKKIFQDNLKVIISQMSDIQKKLDNLKLLYTYSENLKPFLIYENALEKINEIKSEISFLDRKVQNDIISEAQKVKLHLQSIIKSFFNEDLINEIYQRIDPHPELTKIEFIPNLDYEKPRLDIFVNEVRTENDNEEILRSLIPNFYFSAAQINILSLSIFLASALKSEEFDCIFLDDPIQSMDSINVLSTIDLLRGIITNHNKQIILCTHDENFHNLLKKKIPRKLFGSKFLKFETFGKVVEDLN